MDGDGCGGKGGYGGERGGGREDVQMASSSLWYKLGLVSSFDPSAEQHANKSFKSSAMPVKNSR